MKKKLKLEILQPLYEWRSKQILLSFPFCEDVRATGGAASPPPCPTHLNPNDSSAEPGVAAGTPVVPVTRELPLSLIDHYRCWFSEAGCVFPDNCLCLCSTFSP